MQVYLSQFSCSNRWPLIVESVHSICRDSADTKISNLIGLYDNVPFIFKCFHDKKIPIGAKEHRKSTKPEQLFCALIPTLFPYFNAFTLMYIILQNQSDWVCYHHKWTNWRSGFRSHDFDCWSCHPCCKPYCAEAAGTSGSTGVWECKAKSRASKQVKHVKE